MSTATTTDLPRPRPAAGTAPSVLLAFGRSARAEGRRWRGRPLLVSIAVSALVGAVMAGILTATVGESANPTSLRPADLSGPDGMWLPVTSAMTYGAIPLFCLAVALAAGDQQQGPWRTALLHQPRRCVLALGQLLCRWAVLTVVCLTGVVAGSLVTLFLASSAGVDTTRWTVAESAAPALEATLRLVVYIAGWTLLGTTLGVLTRSVPIALGVGLLWCGPVENILGDELSFAPAWFPGLLLRGVLEPTMTPVDGPRVWLMVSVYLIGSLVLLVRAVRTRDVS